MRLRQQGLAGLIALLLLAAAGLARAQPAVVYELGGKFDKSFNQAGWEGAERWKKETGKPYLEFQIQTAAQREQALRRFAERGASPIVGIGFPQASPIAAVAPQFPQLRFAVIDAVVDLPNVQSFVFREHEGGFLAGVMAALATRSGKVGYVGGQDIPIIRKFLCGYEQGAKWANPKVEVLWAMTGTTGAAWNDPVRGAELTRNLAAQGADVVLQAAGGTGVGVLQAARDLGILGIGSDSNQNGLHPGHVLTSLLKRTDVAVYRAFQGVVPGVTELGLKEGGMDLAFDEHNAKIATPAMRQRVEQARAEIVAGRLKPTDWTVAKKCN
jgi:basic membrane protein A